MAQFAQQISFHSPQMAELGFHVNLILRICESYERSVVRSSREVHISRQSLQRGYITCQFPLNAFEL